MNQSQKQRTIVLLVVAEIFAMGLWFVSAAILNDLQATGLVGPALGAWLSSAVPAGFVVGALFVAISGIADRLDPRYVFMASALLGAVFNLLPCSRVSIFNWVHSSGRVSRRYENYGGLGYPRSRVVSGPVSGGAHSRFLIAALVGLVGRCAMAAHRHSSVGVFSHWRLVGVRHTTWAQPRARQRV